jgi:hypothetical protein
LLNEAQSDSFAEHLRGADRDSRIPGQVLTHELTLPLAVRNSKLDSHLTDGSYCHRKLIDELTFESDLGLTLSGLQIRGSGA